MSIEITTATCVGCGQCAAVCPGSLITIRDEVAVIDAPERCWGCASCVKECPVQAIALYLGEDMGGLGGRLIVRWENPRLHWTITLPDGGTKTIVTDRTESNKY